MSEPVVAVVEVTTDGQSFGFNIHSELEPDVLEVVLRQAANEIGGKNDRAAGAWGRA